MKHVLHDRRFRYIQSIIWIASCICILFFGSWMWYIHNTHQKEQASMEYNHLLNISESNHFNEIHHSWKKIQDLDQDPYFSLGGLVAARFFSEHQHEEEALKIYELIWKRSTAPFFREQARLNAANILLSEHRLKEARLIIQTTEDRTLKIWIDLLSARIDIAEGHTHLAISKIHQAIQSVREKGWSAWPLEAFLRTLMDA